MKTMKRTLCLMLALLLIISLGITAMAEEQPAMLIASNPNAMEGKTVILHTNDVHGSVEGYACLNVLRQKYEAMGADVILADAGDFSQGSSYVNFNKGADAVTLMNAAGYDVVTLGNHDFDFGYDQLKSNLKSAAFKVVCANVFDKNGNTLFDPSCVITTESGLKVGFVGIETPETMTKTSPAMIKGLKISAEDTYTCVQKAVDGLQTADLVIALSHLGVDAASKPYTSYDLWNNTTGLDFIIDGHSHTAMTEGANGEAIQSTGSSFQNVGLIIIDNESEAVESHELIPVDESLEKDESTAAVAQKLADKLDGAYNVVFAKSEVTLNGAKAPQGNRDSETNNGDLVADAMLWQVLQNQEVLTVDTDHVVCVTNGGGIRSAVNPGDVTKKDINTVLPFGNTVYVVYVTGETLLEALEASTFCTPDPVGAFPQIAGMDITVDTTKAYDAQEETYPASTYYGPASINRVTVNSVNGEDFSLTDTYAVVTHNFCAQGGDTYYAFTSASAQFDTGIRQDETVIAYITQKLKGVIGETYAAPQGRIHLITASSEETAEKPGETAGNVTYTVVAGDCLWNIAKKYYNNGAAYTRIAAANGIKNPDVIHIGDVLVIPA